MCTQIDRRRFLRVVAGVLVIPVVPLVNAQHAYEDFVLAVFNDRAAEVKSYLARGMDPNTVTKEGDPVLLVAARGGNESTLDVLLAARDIKVDARNGVGDTALMAAAIAGHLGIIKKLRARGAEIKMRGWTPLIYAATGGQDDIVRYLLAEGADINAVSPNGTTALMMAVRENRFSTVELLLSRRADVNVRNQQGATALNWAMRNDDGAVVDLLRRAGARD